MFGCLFGKIIGNLKSVAKFRQVGFKVIADNELTADVNIRYAGASRQTRSYAIKAECGNIQCVHRSMKKPLSVTNIIEAKLINSGRIYYPGIGDINILTALFGLIAKTGQNAGLRLVLKCGYRFKNITIIKVIVDA